MSTHLSKIKENKQNDKCMPGKFAHLYVVLTSSDSKVDGAAITPPLSDSDLYPIVTLILKLCIINDQFWRVEKYTSMILPVRDIKICHVRGIVPNVVFTFLPSYLKCRMYFCFLCHLKCCSFTSVNFKCVRRYK